MESDAPKDAVVLVAPDKAVKRAAFSEYLKLDILRQPLEVLVERNRVTGRFGFKLSEIYDKDARTARLFVAVQEDAGARLAVSESSTAGATSFLESGDEVIGFSETEHSGVSVDEVGSSEVEIISEKLLMDEAVRRLSLVGAGESIKLKVLRAGVQESGASEIGEVSLDNEAGEGSKQVTPLPCATSTDLPGEDPPVLALKQQQKNAGCSVDESLESHFDSLNNVSSEISAVGVVPAPTDVHSISHDDQTIRATDALEESGSTSVLSSNDTSVGVAEQAVSIVNGTIAWYRYSKRNWEWPVVLFESWAALKAWGLPVPAKISEQAQRFGVGGAAEFSVRESVPPLPPGCYGVAFYCGRRCEYGLVKERGRLRAMKADDATPRNPGMSKSVVGDFLFAVEEARELLKGFAEPDDEDGAEGSGEGKSGVGTASDYYKHKAKKMSDESNDGGTFQDLMFSASSPACVSNFGNGSDGGSATAGAKSAKSGTRSSGRRQGEGSRDDSSSRFVGVSWSRARGQWRSMIMLGGVPTFLGHFDSEDEAALMYDMEAAAYGKPVNFPDAGQAQAVKGRDDTRADSAIAAAAAGAATTASTSRKAPAKKKQPAAAAAVPAAPKVPRVSKEAERKKLQRRIYADTVKAKRVAKKEAAAAEADALATAEASGVASGAATNSKPAPKKFTVPLPPRRSSSSSSYGSYARSFAGSPTITSGDDGRRSSRLISRNGPSDGYQAYFQRTLLSARATKCPMCLEEFLDDIEAMDQRNEEASAQAAVQAHAAVTHYAGRSAAINATKAAVKNGAKAEVVKASAEEGAEVENLRVNHSTDESFSRGSSTNSNDSADSADSVGSERPANLSGGSGESEESIGAVMKQPEAASDGPATVKSIEAVVGASEANQAPTSATSPRSSKAVVGVSKAFQALTSAAGGALRLEVKAGPNDEDGTCEVTRMRCCRTWFHVPCIFAHEVAMRASVLRCPICRDTTSYQRQVRQVRRDIAQKEAAEKEHAKKEAKLAIWHAKQKEAEGMNEVADDLNVESSEANKEMPSTTGDVYQLDGHAATGEANGEETGAPEAKRAKVTPIVSPMERWKAAMR